MYASLLLLTAAAFSGMVAADSTTTTVGFFGAPFDITIPLYTSTGASVAGINAVATTYAVSCLDGAPKSDCHIDHPWTIIQGPTTFSLTGVYTAWSTGKNAVTVTRSEKCSFTHYTESASCSVSYRATGTAQGTSYSTATSGASSFAAKSITYYQLPVTGGLSSFTAPQATQTPGAAAAAAGPARALITAAPLLAAAAAAAML
jgi:hypothetical protein